MVDNLGQTDESLVAVTLTHKANIILLGRAFKLLVIFEKDTFWMQKRYIVVHIMDLIMIIKWKVLWKVWDLWCHKYLLKLINDTISTEIKVFVFYSIRCWYLPFPAFSHRNFLTHFLNCRIVALSGTSSPTV